MDGNRAPKRPGQAEKSAVPPVKKARQPSQLVSQADLFIAGLQSQLDRLAGDLAERAAAQAAQQARKFEDQARLYEYTPARLVCNPPRSMNEINAAIAQLERDERADQERLRVHEELQRKLDEELRILEEKLKEHEERARREYMRIQMMMHSHLAPGA